MDSLNVMQIVLAVGFGEAISAGFLYLWDYFTNLGDSFTDV